MGLNNTTRKLLSQYLPARVLCLGYPAGIESVDTSKSDLLVVDIIRHQGCEIIRDLCSPEPLGLGRFDVVLDHGTIEHCSNPAQAFLHVANSVDHFGVAIHHTPITFINHGYWNVNPSWFVDFYPLNGFRLLTFAMTVGDKIEEWPDAPAESANLPMGASCLVVAQREFIREIKLPAHESKWSDPHPVWRMARQLKSRALRLLCQTS